MELKLELKDKPIKRCGKRSDKCFSLISEEDIGNGLSLLVENDDWGRWIGVVDEDNMCLFSCMVYEDKELPDYIEATKNLFK
jgi:hypothetical protein